MLMDHRASTAEIAVYLLDTAINYMGLSPRPELTERGARTAATLIGLRPQFELR